MKRQVGQRTTAIEVVEPPAIQGMSDAWTHRTGPNPADVADAKDRFNAWAARRAWRFGEEFRVRYTPDGFRIDETYRPPPKRGAW